ncbi:MAG: glutamate 5-kinase [Campylobacterales bacterium]|nr:glutamate 5-kinase [Campylobacterales bacterium]
MSKDKIVIKVGSAVLTKGGKISIERIQNLVEFIAELTKKYQVILVTSGAIATGHTILPSISNKTTAGKQALAALGQAALINKYQKEFKQFDITVAQILLTAEDFDSIKRSENAKAAVNTLLDNNIVPIINENDSVIVDEILRGDNDQLSAQVAHYFDAKMLVILSDIKGYFDKDPNKHENAKLRKVVSHIDESELEADYNPNDAFATGGIVTKLKAANFLLQNNRAMFLSSGFDLKSAKEFLMNGVQNEGTLFRK